METVKKINHPEKEWKLLIFSEHEGENTAGTSCVLIPTNLEKGGVGGGQTDQKGPSHPSIRVGNPSVGSRWSREVRSLRFNLKQNKRNDKHTHTSPRHTHTFHSITDTHLSLSLTPTNIMIVFCTLTWPHTWPKLTDYQSIIDESTLLSINFWSESELKLGVLMNTQVNKLLWMERPSHYL